MSMKYIYILALVVIIIICCFFNKESFGPIPPGVLTNLVTKRDLEFDEYRDTAAADTSQKKVEATIENSLVPNTGVVLGKKNIEIREEDFEIEDAKCKSVKMCENLRTNMNCGYCLQDDIRGDHPFHYGDEEGPFLKRDSSGKNSLCKREDGGGPISDEWVPPSALNDKRLKKLEDDEEYTKKMLPNKRDPRRINALKAIQDNKNTLAIKDTGKSGCLKMRERYICSKVNDCSPMNFEMFGIKAKDICGFCADDGNAYTRTDLPDNSKSYKSDKIVSETSCQNIEIFGDGINCSAYSNDKNKCLGKKSLKDPTIKACAFNYNNKTVKVPVTIPKPSVVKYGHHAQSRHFDKCNSEWGLIRPDQCNWFEQAYPCLKTKTGGPHSEKCLQSLWRQMGFVTNYRKLFNNGEGNLVNSWNDMDVNRVMESMQDIYKNIYSQDYDVAKKWVKICFDMNVNDCNRAGLISDKNPSYYWRETSDPCMEKLYKYAGGKEKGLANPKNFNKWSYGWRGSLKEGLSKNEFYTKQRNVNTYFRENQTEHEIYGSQGHRYGDFFKFSKNIPHRDYVNKIKHLVKMKNMSSNEAKKVHPTWSRSNWGKKKFSNSNFTDKYTATKLITGETSNFPVKDSKPCWSDFARKMLAHPNVKLKNLSTLEFKGANEFKSLSYSRGSQDIWSKNFRKAGESVFEGGRNYFLTKDTYDRDTFPFWKFISLGKIYWKNRWDIFNKILIDYSDTEQTTYQNVVRPTNEKQALSIARAYGYRIGGGGYAFAGNYGTKGLYLYTSGRYRGRCYFGRGGSNAQMRTNSRWPKVRVDKGQNQGVIQFLPNSRFYNSLPATTNIQSTWKKPYFFEYTNYKNQKVRILFNSAYKGENFPYYDFLKLTVKN